MDQKVQCPYCGAEMKDEDWAKVDGGYLSYAVCSNDACQSIGPTVTGCETMAEARAAALAAAQARYAPPEKWIGARDKQPPDQEEVLVLTRSKKGIRNIDKGYWSIDHFIHRGCAEVTHWMPLPELPKEADHENA